VARVPWRRSHRFDDLCRSADPCLSWSKSRRRRPFRGRKTSRGRADASAACRVGITPHSRRRRPPATRRACERDRGACSSGAINGRPRRMVATRGPRRTSSVAGSGRTASLRADHVPASSTQGLLASRDTRHRCRACPRIRRSRRFMNGPCAGPDLVSRTRPGLGRKSLEHVRHDGGASASAARCGSNERRARVSPFAPSGPIQPGRSVAIRWPMRSLRTARSRAHRDP
jgi:hypothetical protein